METIRIQTGATERITAVALSAALAPLTGLTDLVISIQRVSDGFWFDFADLTFKSVGWTTRQQAMTEISSTLAPGQYRTDFVTSTITNAAANDAYLVTVTQTPGTTVKNIPQVGELKVGQWVDNLDATITSRATALTAASAVWEELLASHTVLGTFGNEVATKADIAAAAATDYVTCGSGTVIAGTLIAGTHVSTHVRDAVYWQVQESAPGGAGLTVEMTFNLPSAAHRPGSFIGFGRYIGTPAGTHYMELWAYNYVASAWEQLVENFMPGGSTIDTQYSHEFYERHVNRASSNEVKIRLVHNITTYNAGHSMFLDLCEVSGIKVVTAGEIADAVWDEALAGHVAAGSAGEAEGRIDATITSRASAVALAAVQADTDDLQTRVPATLNAGRMRAHVEAMDSDVIGSAQIAAGAIGVSEAPNLDAAISSRAAPGDAMDLVTDAVDAAALATSAITEVDAALSAAHGAGSWEGGTPAAIADAVWDEAKAGHVAGGSFGEEVQSHATQAEILSDATPFPGARIDAAISSRAAPGAAMALTPAERLAVDAQLSGAHGAGSWEGGTPAAIADAVWDEAIAGHSGAGSAGKELQDKPTAPEVDAELTASHGAGTWHPPSVLEVADGVWDEPAFGHTALGSFGIELQDKPTDAEIDIALTAAHGSGPWGSGVAPAIAAAVWDEALPGAHPPGSAGSLLPTRAVPGDAMALTPGERVAVAARTWQEPVPGAYAAGQAGKVLGDNLDALVSSRAVPGSAMTLTPGERVTVADGVWDEAVPGTHIPGSAAAVLAGIDSDVDVPVSSRAAAGDAMALTAPTLGLVAGRVWDEAVPGGHGSGTAGKVLADAGAALDVPVSSRAAAGDAMALTPGERLAVSGQVWDETLPGAHAAGSAGERLATTDNRVDVAVSSRAVPGDAMALTSGERVAVAGRVWDETLPGAHAAGTAGYMVAELEARLTLARAVYLDQIPGLTSDSTLIRQIKVNRLELSEAGGGTWILYADDDVTPRLTWPVRDKNGDPITMNAHVPARRGRGT